MTDVSKDDNKTILICFDPVDVIFFIMMGQRIYTFFTNFLEDSLFLSLKKELSQLSWQRLLRRKNLVQKLETYRFKPQLQKLG